MNILITGGTGLVGRRLTQMLDAKGHIVRYLSRKVVRDETVKYFQWDVEENTIEEGALEDVHAIVHLAGENVAEGRWVNKRKNKIMQSRVDSAKLLFQAVEVSNTKPSTFISASGVGIYGVDTGDELMTEYSPRGDGFLSYVVEKWEQSADLFNQFDMRVVKLRIGVVLSKDGGALEKMAKPIKYMIGSPLGSGKQYISWVHVDDLCRAIIWSIENKEIDDTYNVVSSNPITNKKMTRAIAKALQRKIILPNVPSFILKLVLGEMSTIVLGGNKVSSEKLCKTGFEFEHNNIDSTLSQIFKKN